MRRKLAFAFAGLWALALGLFLLKSLQAPDLPPSVVMAGQATPHAGTTASGSDDAGRRSVVEAALLTPSGRLAQQASRSTNLRAFVESAKQQPQDGGIAYAVGALQYCLHLNDLKQKYAGLSQEIATGSGQDAARRLAGLNRMVSQCSDFTPEELQQASSLRSSGKDRDPILALFFKGFEYSRMSMADQRSLSKSILLARDPYLLHAAGVGIGRVVVDGLWVVFFDGEKFGGVVDAQSYRDAWSLVPCNFGEDCELSSDVVIACVFEGTCHRNRLELLRSSYSGRETEFQGVIRLAAKLTEAVTSGEVDRFFRGG